MDYLEKTKQKSIADFGSEVIKQRYRRIAEDGLWESEAILINKYFPPRSKILDIGCGSGRTTIPLVAMGHDVVGVDITPEMIETAKDVEKAKGLSIDYRIGDATRLEFDDNFFDMAIFANNGWVQIPGKANRQKALAEIYRVLKPGGYFILTAHQRYYSGRYLFFWSFQWLKYLMNKLLSLNIGADYGDIFFGITKDNGKIIKRKQFIHITSAREVLEQLNRSGFKIEEKTLMGKLSQKDAELRRASLFKNYDCFKTPVFYVCQK